MRRLIIIAFTALGWCALPMCLEAQQARQGSASPPHRPFSAMSVSASSIRDSIVARARAQLGRGYVFGGARPELGFDCSGLVQYIMRSLGIEVPRTAAQQARVGAQIERDTTHLRPGDLLVFGSDTLIEHIGIYVGDGRFIHASSVAGRVIESPIRRPPDPLIKPWIGVRRLHPSGLAMREAAGAR